MEDSYVGSKLSVYKDHDKIYSGCHCYNEYYNNDADDDPKSCRLICW